MTPPTVRLIAAADTELEKAVDRYNEEVPGLGDEFAAEVEHAVDMIRRHPEIGRPHPVRTRRVLVRRFPYSIIYRIQQEQIVIIAVAHQRRRPGYWKRRR